MSLASKGKSKSKKHVESLRQAMLKRYKNGWISNLEKMWKENPDFLRGENNPNWIKDRTKLAKSEKKHTNTQYREWMKGVKNRDGWQCKIADGNCSGRLEAHHILNWVNYPELRYQLNNGITLCHAHHPRGRAKEKRMVPTFKELLTVSSE